MNWYDKYKGFPYEHLGNDTETGIDCFNLIRLIYKQELGIDIPYETSDLINNDDVNWYNQINENPEPMLAVANDPKLGWKKIADEPELFDVILISLGATNCINHCALFVDINKLLQVRVDHTSWLSTYGSFYRQYTVGIYRWIGL